MAGAGGARCLPTCHHMPVTDLVSRVLNPVMDPATLLHSILAALNRVRPVLRTIARHCRRKLDRLQDRLRARLRRTNSSNIAANIPRDIQLIVFEYLRDMAIFPAMAQLVIHRKEPDRPPHPVGNNWIRPFKYARDLSACALTCRAWNTAAVEVLVRHVTLLTSHNLDQWAAAAVQLPSTTTRVHNRPYQLVQKLEITIGYRRLSNESHVTSDSAGGRNTDNSPPVYDQELKRILSLCTGLKELTVHLRDDVGLFQAFEAIVREAAPTTSRLRLHKVPGSSTELASALGSISSQARPWNAWSNQLRALDLTGFSGRNGAIAADLMLAGLHHLRLHNCRLLQTQLTRLLLCTSSLKSLHLVDMFIDQDGDDQNGGIVSKLVSPVARQLEELVLIDTSMSNLRLHILRGLNSLRRFTTGTMYYELAGRTRHAVIMPRTVDRLEIVFRARSRERRTTRSIFCEITEEVHNYVLAVYERVDLLREVVIWDYVSDETEAAWITGAVLLRRSLARETPGVELFLNIVRIP